MSRLKFNQVDSHGDVLLMGSFNLSNSGVYHLGNHKSTDLIPEQPKPKADVKEVLADKTKAANTGQVVKK